MACGLSTRTLRLSTTHQALQTTSFKYQQSYLDSTQENIRKKRTQRSSDKLEWTSTLSDYTGKLGQLEEFFDFAKQFQSAKRKIRKVYANLRLVLYIYRILKLKDLTNSNSSIKDSTLQKISIRLLLMVLELVITMLLYISTFIIAPSSDVQATFAQILALKNS